MRKTKKTAARRMIPDGRLERSVRTRQQIAGAVLDLIRAGNLSPTSDEVARYAKVGHRTVFRHFQDMETLLEDVQERVRLIVKVGLSPAPRGAGLAERIDHLVEQRAQTFDDIANYYRSGLLRLHEAATVKRSHSRFTRMQRRRLIELLPETESSPGLVEAADVIASIDVWLRLRQTQRLSVEQAKNVVKNTIARLLKP